MSKLIGRGIGAPEHFHDPSRKRGRASNRDLLTKNRARRQFEAVPAPRHTEPGSKFNQSRQDWIAFQNTSDVRPVGIQIEHGTYPFDDEEKRTWIAKVNAHFERVMLFIERDFKIAGRTVYGNRAKIAARLHCFDTGCCPGCKKRQHPLPVVGRTKTKMKDVLILRLDRLPSRQLPNLSRC